MATTVSCDAEGVVEGYSVAFGSSGAWVRVKEGGTMYIGLGTVLVILAVIVIVMMMRRSRV